MVLARVAAAVVDLADGDLHRGVVLGFDDAVRRRAFAGDVAGVGRGVWVSWGGLEGGGEEGGIGRCGGRRGWWMGMDVQVDELAFVVFHRCWRFEGLGQKGFVVASALIEITFV